jgi:hypothetical protein
MGMAVGLCVISSNHLLDLPLIDASVAVKWFIPEPDSDKAHASERS